MAVATSVGSRRAEASPVPAATRRVPAPPRRAHRTGLRRAQRNPAIPQPFSRPALGSVTCQGCWRNCPARAQRFWVCRSCGMYGICNGCYEEAQGGRGLDADHVHRHLFIPLEPTPCHG